MHEYTIKFSNGSEVIIKDEFQIERIFEILNYKDEDFGVFTTQWGKPILVAKSSILYLSEVQAW